MCVSSKSPSFGLACEIRLHLNALRLYTDFSYDTAIFGVNSQTQPFRFALNASTSVSFTGELHLHAWLAERFEGATSNLSLVSRARQFLALGVGQQGAGDLGAKQKGNPSWTVAFSASMEVRFDKMHQDAMWIYVVFCGFVCAII